MSAMRTLLSFDPFAFATAIFGYDRAKSIYEGHPVRAVA